MKSFNERYREDRRAWLLKMLSEQPGYRANNATLYLAASHYGIAASNDDVLTDLNWLQEQGLIGLERVTDSVAVATLLSRGQDVVHGLTSVPGVSRLQPR